MAPTKDKDTALVTPDGAPVTPNPAARKYERPTEKSYYIVNPSGAIHGVTREHATGRLRQDPRYRMATKPEIQALHDANGRQQVGRPLARPYAVDPDVDINLDDED